MPCASAACKFPVPSHKKHPFIHKVSPVFFVLPDGNFLTHLTRHHCAVLPLLSCEAAGLSSARPAAEKPNGPRCGGGLKSVGNFRRRGSAPVVGVRGSIAFGVRRHIAPAAARWRKAALSQERRGKRFAPCGGFSSTGGYARHPGRSAAFCGAVLSWRWSQARHPASGPCRRVPPAG